MGKIYVGDTGIDVVVDCGEDITEATETVLKVSLPDGTEAQWSASVHETTKLRYVTGPGDLAQYGRYRVQASLVLKGWNGRGRTASFQVYEKYQ